MSSNESAIVRTTLRPSQGWVGVDIGELVRFRQLLAVLAQRDIKLRYKQTLLGVGWVVLQPLVGAGIFSFVFGVVAGMQTSSGRSYFLFSFVGLLAWNVFASTLSKSAACMVGNTHLITKVYFPRLILPLSTAASSLVDFLVPALVLTVILIATGSAPGWSAALIPAWVLLALLMGLGLGMVAAALTIEYRDVQYILPLVVPFLLYASPVAYDIGHVPDRYRTFYYLANPLASVIEGFRWSLIGTAPPPWVFVGYAVICGLGLFGLGTVVFRWKERRVADVI